MYASTYVVFVVAKESVLGSQNSGASFGSYNAQDTLRYLWTRWISRSARVQQAHTARWLDRKQGTPDAIVRVCVYHSPPPTWNNAVPIVGISRANSWYRTDRNKCNSRGTGRDFSVSSSSSSTGHKTGTNGQSTSLPSVFIEGSSK
jgi:hypothetical protein